MSMPGRTAAAGRSRDASVAELTTDSPPVGVFEDASYEVGTVTLPSDGTVLMSTDGVVEARNPDDEKFGLVRLSDVCARRHEDLSALLATVMETVRGWSRDREQEDDITLLALAVEDE
jgi:sigma-B regulation protein RsbU (phosphoserine phosphatase)